MTTGQIITLVIFSLIFVASVVLIVVFLRREEKETIEQEKGYNYDNTLIVKHGYMSEKELIFLEVLQRAMSTLGLLAFPKVAISKIIESKDPKHKFSVAFSYTVDFCLFTKNDYSPVLIIDLYDNTIGDQTLTLVDPIVARVIKSAGLPILTLEIEEKYNEKELKEKIENALNEAIKNAIGKNSRS